VGAPVAQLLQQGEPGRIGGMLGGQCVQLRAELRQGLLAQRGVAKQALATVIVPA